MKEAVQIQTVAVRAPEIPCAAKVSLPATAPAEGTGDTPLMRRFCTPFVRSADLVSLSAALLVALFSPSLASGQHITEVLALRVSIQNLIYSLLLLVTWKLIFWISGLYQTRQSSSQFGFMVRAPFAVGLASLPITAALLVSAHPARSVVSVILHFWPTALVFMALTRVAIFTYEDVVRPALRKKRTVIVVGTGPRARMLTQQLIADPSVNYHVAGFVDADPQPECGGLGPLLGATADLGDILMRRPVDEVMVALPLKSSFAEVEEVVATCSHAGVKMLYSVELFHSNIAKNQRVDEATGVRSMEMVHNDHRLLLKDIFDRTAAFFGLLLLSPLFAAIALAIKLTSKGPVFFVQERWGMNKRTFGMIKFRSMVIDAEAQMAALETQNELGGPMFKMRNDPRVTPIGRLLRRTSLDELPQLINVLKGDMSLVGPRPLPNRDVERFSELWLMRRFSVKPGITGLWQVSGRSETDFDQTIRLDLQYIDRWNLPLDLKILLKTLNVVIRGKGAY